MSKTTDQYRALLQSGMTPQAIARQRLFIENKTPAKVLARMKKRYHEKKAERSGE